MTLRSPLGCVGINLALTVRRLPEQTGRNHEIGGTGLGETMRYHDHDELALLMLMNDQRSIIDVIHENGPDAICGLLQRSAGVESWYLAPGREHLPAEIGGRIAEARSDMDGAKDRRGEWLREFGAGELVSNLEPLEFDHKSLMYTGTIFWETPGMGVSV